MVCGLVASNFEVIYLKHLLSIVILKVNIMHKYTHIGDEWLGSSFALNFIPILFLYILKYIVHNVNGSIKCSSIYLIIYLSISTN